MLAGFLVCTVAFAQMQTAHVVRFMSYRHSDYDVPLWRFTGSPVLFYRSKMSCDVDGAPNAYHPLDDNLSLDVIESAGGARKGGLPNGELTAQPDVNVVAYQNGAPYVQPDGPYKGFYVSKTSYENPSLPEIDPTRYLDSRVIQYVVLPGGMVPEAQIGDLIAVYDPDAKTLAFAVFGDIGPGSESGEASLATLKRLGMAATDGKSSPAETRKNLLYMVFPGSGPGSQKPMVWPINQAQIDRDGQVAFDKYGGMSMVQAMLTVP
jgi:hypothetical protein